MTWSHKSWIWRYQVNTWVCIGECILNDPPWESIMDRYMSVIYFLMWLLVWLLVLKLEVTMNPYIRSYVLWFRQTSPVTGWTIKAITGYVTNYAEGCEWCRWDLSLPYDGSDIGILDRVRPLSAWPCPNESTLDVELIWSSESTWSSRFRLIRGWHGLCLILINLDV